MATINTNSQTTTQPSQASDALSLNIPSTTSVGAEPLAVPTPQLNPQSGLPTQGGQVLPPPRFTPQQNSAINQELGVDQAAMFPTLGGNNVPSTTPDTSLFNTGLTNGALSNFLTPEQSKNRIPIISEDIKNQEKVRMSTLSYTELMQANEQAFGGIGDNRPALFDYSVNPSEVYTRLLDGTYVATVPNYIGGTNNVDRLAQQQSGISKIGYGVLKWAGKTLTNVVGGTVGLVAGAISAAEQGRWSAIYDNSFNNWLDDLNTRMGYSLPNYKSAEEQQKSFLSSMGTINFWADDFLNGVSFLTGALLSEAVWSTLTLGAATPAVTARLASRIPRAFSAGGATEALSTTRNTLKALNRATYRNKALGAANTFRFATTSSFYESGVEARHSFHESMDDFVANIQNAYGRPPTAEELSEFTSEALDAANAIFGANVAIVGSSNYLQIGSYFGLKPSLSKNLSKYTRNNIFGNKTIVTRGENGLPKYNAIRGNRFQRGLETSFNVFKRPVVEGVWEEGMQGVVSNTSKSWLESRFNPSAAEENKSLITSFIEGMKEAYGTTEGRREIGLGMLIGFLGSAGIRGGDGRNIRFGFREASTNTASREQAVEDRNTYTESIKKDTPRLFNKIARLNQHNTALQNFDQQAERGNLTEASIELSTADFTRMQMQDESGEFQDAIEDFETIIESVTREELDPEFQTLSDEELADYKARIMEVYRADVQDYKEAMEIARAMNPSAYVEDRQIENFTGALALNIFQGKKAASRITELSEAVEEALGEQGYASALSNLAMVDNERRNLGRRFNRLSSQRETLQNQLVDLQQQLNIVEGNRLSEERATERVSESDRLRTRIADTTRRLTGVENSINQLRSQVGNTKGNAELLQRRFLNIDTRSMTIEQLGEMMLTAEQIREITNSIRRNPNVAQSSVQSVEFLLQEYSKNVAALDNFLATASRMADERYNNPQSSNSFLPLANVPGKFLEQMRKEQGVGRELPQEVIDKVDAMDISEDQKFTLGTLIAMGFGNTEVQSMFVDQPTSTPGVETVTDTQWAESSAGAVDPPVLATIVDKKVNNIPLTPREAEIYKANRQLLYQRVYRKRMSQGLRLPQRAVGGETDIQRLRREINNAFIDSPTLQQENDLDSPAPRPTDEEVREFSRLDRRAQRGDFDRATLTTRQQEAFNRYTELRDKINKFGNLLGTPMMGGVTLADAYSILDTLEQNTVPTTTAVITQEDVGLMTNSIPFIEQENRANNNLLTQVWDKVTMTGVSNIPTLPNKVVERGVVVQGLTLGGMLQHFNGVTRVVRLGDTIEQIEVAEYLPEPQDNLSVQFENGDVMSIHLSERSTLMFDMAEQQVIEANSDLQFEYLGNFSSNYKFLMNKDYQLIESDYNEQNQTDMDVQAIYALEVGDQLTPKVDVDIPYNRRLIDRYNASRKTEYDYNRLKDNLIVELYDKDGNWVSMMKAIHSDSVGTTSYTRLNNLRKAMANQLTGVQPISDLETALEVRADTNPEEGSTTYMIYDSRTNLTFSSVEYETAEEAEQARTEYIEQDIVNQSAQSLTTDMNIVVEDVLPGHPNFNIEDGALQFIPIAQAARDRVVDIGYIEGKNVTWRSEGRGINNFPFTAHIMQDTKGLYTGKRIPVVAIRIGNKTYAYQARFNPTEINIVPELDIIANNMEISAAEKIRRMNQVVIGAGLSTEQYGFIPQDLNQDAYNRKIARIEGATIAQDIRTVLADQTLTTDMVLDQLSLDINLETDVVHSPKLRVNVLSTAEIEAQRTGELKLDNSTLDHIESELETPC